MFESIITPDQLLLIQLTLRSLKGKEHAHMLQQLIDARTRYVMLNFKETT